uniref:Uncharacterized protein n=1 Tax=Anguilla anguilla TaxID=7936 RepID=A0A0E9SC17_ANGAN
MHKTLKARRFYSVYKNVC